MKDRYWLAGVAATRRTTPHFIELSSFVLLGSAHKQVRTTRLAAPRNNVSAKRIQLGSTTYGLWWSFIGEDMWELLHFN